MGAGHLKVGDKLKQADGTLGEVKYVSTIQEARTMYNLEVEEAHTFFVGSQGWLVHNGGKPEGPKPPSMPMKIAEFGNLIGWGKGEDNYQDSLKTYKELTPEHIQKLKDAGITKEMMEQWVKVYGYAAENGKGGKTARGRSVLTQKILRNWDNGCF